MPHCPICDSDVEKFGDDCTACKAAVEEALDDFDISQNEGVHTAGIVMPMDRAPLPEED